MSEIKVNSIKGVGASTAAITVNNTDGSCTANITNNLSNRNLIINGAMQVAQRSTSSTTSGYATVDRWTIQYSSTGVTVTQSQQATSSSDEPYQNGFQNFARIALASAGTASAGTYIEFQQRMEAQNIANSGWNFKSSSSNITVSFWLRASTNQTFYGYLGTSDGTAQRYTFSFTASGNNAWTKITKTIPGNSNLDFDDDNGQGLHLILVPFYGTSYTNNKTLDTWAASDNANFMPDMASTWLTAGASTFDITGVQIEVGSVATDFEHRSFADEIQRCYRYYWQSNGQLATTQPQYMIHGDFINKSTTVADCSYRYAVRMRTSPTVGTNGTFKFDSHTTVNLTSLAILYGTEIGCQLRGTTGGSLNSSSGIGYSLLTVTNTDFLSFSAEL